MILIFAGISALALFAVLSRQPAPKPARVRILRRK